MGAHAAKRSGCCSWEFWDVNHALVYPAPILNFLFPIDSILSSSLGQKFHVLPATGWRC